MSEAVKKILSAYDLSTSSSTTDALREIIQEIALLGLSRSPFFSRAAFYGGTSLRIFHGLDRYSEDMDFSLLQEDADFDIAAFEKYIINELNAFGLDVAFEKKKKRVETRIESAFLKANTRTQFLVIEEVHAFSEKIPRGQTIRIKIEIDTDPPPGFETEIRYHLRPIPFSVRIYVPPDLFAGKMHALLCRGWKGRVKGRDWYDFVWYVACETPLRLSHLESRMRQSGHDEWEGKLTPEIFRAFMTRRIEELDVESAKNDVIRFLPIGSNVSIWSRDFFLSLIEKIRFTE